MNLRAAAGASLGLVALSFGLLWVADDPTDAVAIAGATGLVISSSLLGLTLLAWRWNRARRAYVHTVVDAASTATQSDEQERYAARADVAG
jgi:hypothetical protein